MNRSNCPNCGIKIIDMKSPKYLSYVYYYSTKEKKNPDIIARGIEEKEIDIFLKRYLEENFNVSQDLSDWCIRHISDIKDKEVEDNKAVCKSQTQANLSAKNELRELIRMKSKGLISEKEFIEMKKEITVSVGREDKLDIDWVKEATKLFSLSASILDILKEGNLQQKKETLSDFGANLILSSGKLSIYNTKSVSAFIEGRKSSEVKKLLSEPNKTLVNKRQTEVFASACPALLRTLDNVRIAIKEENNEKYPILLEE